MTIREAKLSDAAEISRFVTRLATQHIGPTISTAGLETLLSSMDEVETEQRIAENWLHLLDLENGVLRGLIVVKPPTHLFHLFVATDVQRSGIGRQLFELADQRTLQEAGTRIQTVNSSLNSIPVYVQLGFAANGSAVDQAGVRFQPMIRVAD